MTISRAFSYQHLLAMLLLLALLIAGSRIALAQSYDEYGQPFGNNYYAEMPSTVYVSLLRLEGLPPDNFVLRLALENARTGCPRLSNIESEVSYIDTALEIQIYDYRVDMRDLPQYAHYDCDVRQQYPSADIILSKDELINQGIREIRFRMMNNFDFYDLYINDEMVQIMPSQKFFQITNHYKPHVVHNISNTLINWFYPDNTLIVYAPRADEDPKLRDKIKELGDELGLIPLDEIFYDFQSPLKTKNHIYFIDNKGDLTKKVGRDKAMRIGSISIDKKVYGLVADEMHSEDIDVFAKKPGMYE